MNWKEFIFYVFLSLFIFFLKSFLSSFLFFYPGDLIFALAIVIVSFYKVNILTIVFLVYLGCLRGIEDTYIGFFWIFVFLLCLYVWNYLKIFLTINFEITKIYNWLGYALFLGILQFSIYLFLTGDVSLEIKDYFLAFLKCFWIAFATFLWIVLFAKILIFKEFKDEA